MKEIFLKPGEIAFSQLPACITTVLGSCIAVSIFDKKKKIGGLCHYYLPSPNGFEAGGPSYKYGEKAIPSLLKEFKNNGSFPQDLEAKIIGGANVLGTTGSDLQVGTANTNLAKQLLQKFNVKVVAEASGGLKGRKIRFYSHTGAIEMKLLANEDNELEEVQRIENKNAKPAKWSGASSFTAPVPPTPIPIRTGPVKVLIVDDSKSMRMILRKMLEAYRDITVMAEAENAEEAKKIIQSTPPDLITLDINMPGMDGVTFLKSYMSTTPIPTIMISSLNKAESGPVFDALESGAFDYIKKPSLDEIDNMASELHDICLAAANSKYIAKRPSIHSSDMGKTAVDKSSTQLQPYLIAIGASTGGTEAIKDVLIDLPANIPPIIITQHIPPVFSAAFADRLNTLCKFSVKEAQDGDELLPGKAYVAPGGKHLRLKKQGSRRIIQLTDDPPVNRFRPSVDYMFDSVSEGDCDKVIAILLTGMGADGARGLLKLKNKMAYTIAQDEATSIVYGMPKVAKDLGAASDVLPLDAIASKIAQILNKK